MTTVNTPMRDWSAFGRLAVNTDEPLYDIQVGDNAGYISLGGAPTINTSGAVNFINSNTVKNFSIRNNNYVSGGFGIGRSTVVGGSTFTDADFIINSAGHVGFGLTPTANMVGLSIEAGVMTIKETTTPTADTDYGKVYCKSDNKLYFQDGAGAEHEISLAT